MHLISDCDGWLRSGFAAALNQEAVIFPALWEYYILHFACYFVTSSTALTSSDFNVKVLNVCSHSVNNSGSMKITKVQTLSELRMCGTANGWAGLLHWRLLAVSR